MAESFGDRLRHAWNAFTGRDPPVNEFLSYDNNVEKFADYNLGTGSTSRPDKVRMNSKLEKSIVSAIYNRIAIDCAAVNIQHVRLDDNGRYLEKINSNLNYCLTTEANIDQSSRSFMEDIVISMCDEGIVAVVPVETTLDPLRTASYDILQMRTGKITQWFPKHVKVELYNDRIGKYQEITIPKSAVAIIENPFYSIMNEPNSTMKRLIRKLALLDVVDEQSSSGKLDLIIQLPYVIKSEARKQQADQRRKDIEEQLSGTKYGIAYTDGTERITQLNRPIENNLLKQVEYLTEVLYSQLGITKEILEGTADEKTMLNYNNRTIEPILSAIIDEMKRKFLTRTARSQRQSIVYFKDPFKLVPVNNIAEIADKFTRNEIMSSNEIRQIIGMKPVNAPEADQLRNKNLNAADGQKFANTVNDDSEVLNTDQNGSYNTDQFEQNRLQNKIIK